MSNSSVIYAPLQIFDCNFMGSEDMKVKDIIYNFYSTTWYVMYNVRSIMWSNLKYVTFRLSM